ncbi:MAG TPA: DUF58 domain-containing protein [Planctomycetes bacterium]|nr:DUF58 domain-containing protein [Planctomycetota bacterium]
MGRLFDGPFLRRLESLRYASRRVPRGGRPAEQTSKSLGGGVEFADYRAYVPGEDMRRVDWMVYLRLGKLFSRLFTEELDLPVHVALDLSDSVFLPPERGRAALQAAAAFSWVALSGQDRVRVHPFGADPLPGFGPVSGKGAGMRLLDWLEGLGPSGGTGIEKTLRRIRGLAGRRGLLVVVSDFFSPSGIGGVLEELARQRHRLLLVQLVHPHDSEPPFQGEIRVIDCETREERDVTVTPAVLERYRSAWKGFQEELRSFALRRGAYLLSLQVTVDVISQVEALFLGGRLPL